MNAHDMRPVSAAVYFIPIEMRLPLKFGPETVTDVTVARVRIDVEDSAGHRATGWGETPLNVQWVWPSSLEYEERHAVLRQFCSDLVDRWAQFDECGHALEVGHAFQKDVLPSLFEKVNEKRAGSEPMPWLAALVCCSPFDLAIHDAYGKLHGLPCYETYDERFLNRDLAAYLEPAEGSDVRFDGRYPADYLVKKRPNALAAWHLVGGKDLLSDDERDGSEPDDGHPVVLRDWIRRDGLTCLKIKLCGNDAKWDYERIVAVGRIAIEEDCVWLTADFNCTVRDTEYVNDILDRLVVEHPRIYGMILYVEQPFPYDLETHRIDVHSVSARKPLFMDESAHDWELVKLGRSLGWTGVALKTCKTQTGALLSLAWARAHGMTLMVQDLTNPMMAQISHVLLAAHTGTIMGVETNGMQFYPEASEPEARVHPGLFRRRQGVVDLSSVGGPGFGYGLEESERDLPEPARVSS